MAFILPANYKFVVAALSLPPLMDFILAGSVMNARTEAKVSLPQLFASEQEAARDPLKYKFNCIQKAAINYNEHFPSFMFASMIAGVKFPCTVAGGVLVWFAARLQYHYGYSSGNPDRRLFGSYTASLVQYATFAGAIASGVMVLL